MGIDLDPAANGNANESQVGGRQACMRLAPQGGGYQDVCNALNGAFDALPPIEAPGANARRAPVDPRIGELRRVGLPRIWITVAQAIGFDAFVAMWRVLMQGGHVDDRCRVVVPNYSRYLRFQRNQMIRQLIDEGFGVDEIRVRVKSSLGETVSDSHIRRAAQRN